MTDALILTITVLVTSQIVVQTGIFTLVHLNTMTIFSVVVGLFAAVSLAALISYFAILLKEENPFVINFYISTVCALFAAVLVILFGIAENDDDLVEHLMKIDFEHITTVLLQVHICLKINHRH